MSLINQSSLYEESLVTNISSVSNRLIEVSVTTQAILLGKHNSRTPTLMLDSVWKCFLLEVMTRNEMFGTGKAR